MSESKAGREWENVKALSWRMARRISSVDGVPLKIIWQKPGSGNWTRICFSDDSQGSPVNEGVMREVSFVLSVRMGKSRCDVSRCLLHHSG